MESSKKKMAKKDEPKFSGEHSLRAVISYAREVFGDPGRAYSWMNTPNPMLKDMRPRDYIEYGNAEDLDLVLDELGRIDQGAF